MGTNIELKDLYNEEQTYENIGTVAVPKADGSGNEYYVKRPVINYTLLDPPTHEIATTQVQDIFVWNVGDGTISGVSDDGNFFGAAYAAVSGKTTKPIVSIVTWKHLTGATVNSAGRAHIIYLYEELAGAVLQEVISYTGSTDFTAQIGWGQLLLDDNNSVTGYAKVDDPSAVSIGIEQPNRVLNADIFYSLLSEVTQEAQTLSVTENGEQTIVPTAGKSGIRKVALNVNVAGGGGGVQPDWNQNDSTAADFVKNRPGAYYEITPELTFTYDGNPVGKTVFVLGDGLILVKVSGAELPTQEQFAQPNNSLTMHSGTSGDTTVELGILTYNPNYSGASVWSNEEAIIALVPSQEVATALDVDIGVYFGIGSATEPSADYISSLVCKEIKYPVELPSKFLETDFSGRDVSAASVILSSSTSGSTKKFKITVDDTGKLTATEVTN